MDLAAVEDAFGQNSAFSIVTDAPPTRVGSTDELSGVTVGQQHICGVKSGDLYCAYTGSNLTPLSLGGSAEALVLQEYGFSFGNTFQMVLPTCYVNPTPLSDSQLAAMTTNERNLAMEVFSVSASGYSTAETSLSGFRPSAGWQKARFTEECDALFDGSQPQQASPRPSERTFTAAGASTLGGSCFLTEGVTPAIQDDGEAVSFSNVRCFGAQSAEGSPDGIYHPRASAATNRLSARGMGPVPIAHFAGSQFAARKASQIVAGSHHYCVLYRPETVGGTQYDDTRVVCWGTVVAVQGLGLGTDANGDPVDVNSDLFQPETSRAVVVNLAGDLGTPDLPKIEGKPRDIPMNDGDVVLGLTSLQSAVCARIINEDITGSTDIVLLRCWGDYDNLKGAGMLAPQLGTDTYANRVQAGTMSATSQGPPYLWLGRGWGWDADDFSGSSQTGYSISAFGASVDGLPIDSQNGKVYLAASGAQVACFAAAADDSQLFRGGVVCVQDLSDSPKPASGGKITATSPTPATVTSTDFLEFLGSVDGSGPLDVHGLAITTEQACALYSTDSISRALKCWGRGELLPSVQQSNKFVIREGAAIASQTPFVPNIESGETCSGLQGADDPIFVVTATIDISYENAQQQQLGLASGDSLQVPARQELAAAGSTQPGASVPIAEVSVSTESCGVSIASYSMQVQAAVSGDDSEHLYVPTDSNEIRALASGLDFETFPAGGWEFVLQVSVEFSNGDTQELSFPGVFALTNINEAPVVDPGSAAGSVITVSAPFEADSEPVQIAAAAVPSFADPEDPSGVVYYLLGKDVDHPQIPSPDAPGVAGLQVLDRSSGSVALDMRGLNYETGDIGEFVVQLVACDGELDQLPSGKFSYGTAGVLCSVASTSVSNTVRFSCRPGAGGTGDQTCEVCSPGRFQPSVSTQECGYCDLGSFAASSGATQCTACAAASLLHEEAGQSEACFVCSDADENAAPNADRSACECSSGYEAVGDSGSGRGESIECESIAEIEFDFGSAERFTVQDD